MSYAKAVDIWMGASLGFVFGVMIEFTAVNYLHRRNSIYNNARRSQLAGHQRSSTVPDKLQPGEQKLNEFNSLLFEVSFAAVS